MFIFPHANNFADLFKIIMAMGLITQTLYWGSQRKPGALPTQMPIEPIQWSMKIKRTHTKTNKAANNRYIKKWFFHPLLEKFAGQAQFIDCHIFIFVPIVFTGMMQFIVI
jgi:hypothetical protein